MSWNLSGLKVSVDLSTYCNAGCPQCHRTHERGLGKEDWLPLVQWSVDTFKKAFPPEEMSTIKQFKFCGTWGDPIMCKDVDKICEYIIDNSNAVISMDTNGSIRNPEWWWNLGVGCGERLTIVFDIDGINQEMHEKYRRFTSLEKVLENMEMLSFTKAKVHSQTILFKHNEDYQKEITDLAMSNGSSRHSFVISDRFESKSTIDGKRYFINPEGTKEYLEPADRKKLPGAKVSGRKVAQLEKEIICRWAKPRNEIVVNPDGQVFPCCFHANGQYQNQFNEKYGKDTIGHPLYMEEYNKNLKKYNVHYTPLSEIMNSNFYKKTLLDSMKGDNPIRTCEKHCSSRITNEHQLRVSNVS